MASHRHYWYFHRDPRTNEIIYVGVGMYDRAWMVQNRQPDHRTFLREILDEGFTMDQVVEMGDTMISKPEALESELELIDEHKPQFNRNYRLNSVCKVDKETFDLILEMRSSGMSYQKIAVELELSAMLIHRIVNGKSKKYEQFAV